jgi:hypothetical protein
MDWKPFPVHPPSIHPSLACWFIQSGFCLPCFPKLTIQVYLLISWKIFKYSQAFLQHGFVGFLGEREREREREIHTWVLKILWLLQRLLLGELEWERILTISSDSFFFSKLFYLIFKKVFEVKYFSINFLLFILKKNPFEKILW